MSQTATTHRMDMRRALPVSCLCVVLLWSCQVCAQDRVFSPGDGKIIGQCACAPWEATYAEFIEQYAYSYARERRAAQRHGLTMPSFGRMAKGESSSGLAGI
jgi:hypothetical protein